MKKVFTKLLAIGSLGLLMVTSCKKEGTLVKTDGGTPGTLTATTTTPVLDRAKVDDSTKIITFNFTPAQYGYTAAATNTLQIDADGDNWKNPTSFTFSASSKTQSYNTSDLNAMLLKLNLPAGQAAKVNVRVQYSISTAINKYSNVLSLTATPFNLTSWIYIVGQFQGWSTTAADSLISVTGNGIYTGVINFGTQTGGNNQFLILPTKSFNTKYATTAGPDTATTSSTYATEFVTGGGNNFVLKNQGGVYIVTINTISNVLTLVPADGYSLIGNAIPGSNWSVDTPLKFINDGNNIWSVTGLSMTKELPPNDGFKMRLNDDWGTSWGTSSTDGQLTSNNGVNIGVAADGKYNFSITAVPTVKGGTVKPSGTINYTFAAQ